MFSVVIPAYNCERTITESLNSVIEQTRIDLIEEIIIVNDGSTDNTEKIIKDYIDGHKEFDIRYISQSNKGVSAARNIGIRLAKGEWIALLDSDDVWMRNKIERQAEVIKDNEEIVFLGADYPLYIYFKKYKSGLFNISAKQLCFRYTPATPSVVFKRGKGMEMGLFNENMRFGEDANFFQRFIKINSYHILAEKLIKTSVGKKYYGESGLSSHLKEMHRARCLNAKIMYKEGMITSLFYIFISIFNEVKYVRRSIMVILSKIKNL